MELSQDENFVSVIQKHLNAWLRSQGKPYEAEQMLNLPSLAQMREATRARNDDDTSNHTVSFFTKQEEHILLDEPKTELTNFMVNSAICNFRDTLPMAEQKKLLLMPLYYWRWTFQDRLAAFAQMFTSDSTGVFDMVIIIPVLHNAHFTLSALLWDKSAESDER